MEKEALLLKQSLYDMAGSGWVLSSTERNFYESTTTYRILYSAAGKGARVVGEDKL